LEINKKQNKQSKNYITNNVCQCQILRIQYFYSVNLTRNVHEQTITEEG